MHVTVNTGSNGLPIEVFATYELPGIDGTHGLLNAMCRLASRLLQANVPAAVVARMMRGQADGWPPVWSGGQRVVSAADAIAGLLDPGAEE